MGKGKNENESDSNLNGDGSGDSQEYGDESSLGLEDADFSSLDQGSAEGSLSNLGGGIEEELVRLKMESEDNKDKYLRALAELENYKKRALKERSELMKYQGEKVLYDMLELADNIELALQYAEADPGKIKEGLGLIHKRLMEVFAKWEVRSESGMGKDFDPEKYAAISKVAVQDTKPGTIINELKKVYFYKDKLLRPGEVVVSDAMPANSEQEGLSEEG